MALRNIISIFLGKRNITPIMRSLALHFVVLRYRNGDDKPPYGIWRKILVATGRVPQEVEPVIAFMRGKSEE